MDTTFWVAVSFVLFIALLVYFAVPRKIISALDKRAESIQQELAEARRLREEAQSILADYQRKQRDAEQEANDIIAQAEREAQAYAQETRKQFEDMLNRRVQMADEKIARAEAQAVAEVRSRAVDASVEAAEQIIAEKLDEDKARALVQQSVEQLKKHGGAH
ncbi:F0F1 ATP synthase subunit B [Dichotomicrobium thermohalophilum]|uniref:ATP synthase subunit b n=1 Tax=Dichotomicrobium thermohalophilum TaxID=933063 RepID=A0A397Q7D8_9HYPH|nr:F0F1 ATP synthase subunit B [Dichotomicrobium thermohalophilum]RIA56399.1 F-type H+-transporting ATPase subunit b [Dichotomicrobium thermohalophilum]